jgi:hypothetical protein
MRHSAIVAAAALPGAFGFSPTAGVPQGVAETEGAEYSAQWPSRRAVAAHHGSVGFLGGICGLSGIL